MSTPELPPAPHLVIGGCRSGKSVHAERLCTRFPPPYRYLATARVLDPEMEDRVRAHRERRGSHWHNLEVPTALPDVLRDLDPAPHPVLIDCATMWLTNLLLDHDQDTAASAVHQLCSVLPALPYPLIIVSNEVGLGIVPENALARKFRDLAGWANQQLAQSCTAVTWMVAGIPVNIKPAGANIPF